MQKGPYFSSSAEVGRSWIPPSVYAAYTDQLCGLVKTITQIDKNQRDNNKP